VLTAPPKEGQPSLDSKLLDFSNELRRIFHKTCVFG
jgi:hypothetical protein